MEEETSMFFACYSATMIKNEHVWFIDSGCNNHMTSYKSLLIYVGGSVNTMIKMGNGQIVQAIEKSTLVIETKNKTRYIKEVMLVPGLDENLLSVSHVVQHVYFLLFVDDMVAIFEDRQLEHHVVTMQITGNR
ncbi:hypothetical protein ACFX2G_015112 [Malus domestica]